MKVSKTTGLMVAAAAAAMFAAGTVAHDPSRCWRWRQMRWRQLLQGLQRLRHCDKRLQRPERMQRPWLDESGFCRCLHEGRR